MGLGLKRSGSRAGKIDGIGAIGWTRSGFGAGKIEGVGVRMETIGVWGWGRYRGLMLGVRRDWDWDGKVRKNWS